MKYFNSIIFIVFATLPSTLFCQYFEDFNVANRGAITVTPFVTDLTGVNWSVALGPFTAPATGTGNYAKTVSGALEYTNTDSEVCFTSPILNISSPAGPRTIAIPFEAVLVDLDDWIQVDYQVNGGAFVSLGNQFGGGTNTVQVTTVAQNANLSGTITASGISGNTLKIRICGKNTATNEFLRIFSLSVPETGTTVLPVKWGDVVAKKTNEGNQVSWATYKEVNNDYFEIQRSVNGGTIFENIGTVKGAGNTNETNEYTFIDQKNTDQSSIIYYRIKQTDFDGRFEYSSIVAVKNEKDISYNVSPNPFTDKLTFSMNESLNSSEKIIITDMHGKTVKEITSYNGPLDTTDFASGMYFVRFPSGEVSKIIKP